MTADHARAAAEHQDIGAIRPAPYTPDYGIKVGDLLRRELGARGLSQAELAARTGLSTKHVNQVVQGVVPLSTSTALLIERALGLSAELLTAIEAGHQATTGRARAIEGLAEYAAWFRRFPLTMLRERGIVTKSKTQNEQIGQLLEFFGVANPDAFDRLYADDALSFRRAQHLSVDVSATAVWLRLAELEAARLRCDGYDRRGFAELLPHLRDLTRGHLSEAFPELQRQCAKEGVAVVHAPDIPGARVYAATRWLSASRPVIALSGRGQYEDGVWFSFFHEAGHVILHPTRRSLIHLEPEGGDDGDGAESEANRFARRTLLGNEVNEERLKSVKSVADARALAADLGVHEGIVAGQAAYAQQRKQAWARLSKARRKATWI